MIKLNSNSDTFHTKMVGPPCLVLELHHSDYFLDYFCTLLEQVILGNIVMKPNGNVY